MADQPLFGGSPAVSPEALKTRRNLAAALQLQGQDASPIRSPWQGVGRMVQSAMGGYEGYQSDQAELQARQASAAKLAQALQSNNIGGAVGAMSDPFTNPEAAKVTAGLLTPQFIDQGLGGQFRDRFGNAVGPFIPKQQIVNTKYGEGLELPGMWQGTPGGGYQVLPAQGGGGYVPANQPPAISPQVQSTIDWANKNAATKAGMKTTEEEGNKARMSIVAEDQKHSKTAPQAIAALNVIEDTMRQYGGSITTGPMAKQVLQLKQAVNGLLGSNVLGDTAPAEVVSKMNAQLASAALPAFTARGTQFDLKTYMEANPGLLNSPQGTLFMTNLLKQIHRQDFELSKLANDKANWGNWPEVKQKFYDEHPLINPLTQRPLGMDKDTPAQQGFSRDQMEAEARRRGLLK